MERVELMSENVVIAGNYFPNEGDEAVILLHQLGKDKNSWGDFPSILQENGFSVLAIDLRGHGESTMKKTSSGPLKINYENFSEADWKGLYYDVWECLRFLGYKKNKTNIHIIGASIGANAALVAGATAPADASGIDARGRIDNGIAAPAPKKMVLLSPGLDYRGIKTEEIAAIIGRGAIFSYEKNKFILIVASKEDSYSFESSEKLCQLIGQKRCDFIQYEGAGHGSNMLIAKPELKNRIIAFLKSE